MKKKLLELIGNNIILITKTNWVIKGRLTTVDEEKGTISVEDKNSIGVCFRNGTSISSRKWTGEIASIESICEE